MTTIINFHQRLLNILVQTESFLRRKFLDRLKDLNTSKSPGPDLIHPKILWEIRDEIVHSLQIIFETSFRLGILLRIGD